MAPALATQSTATTAPARSLATAFDPRRNSFNFLRLLLALVVLVSHSWFLGGYGDERIWHVSTPGTLAVYGFFAISGFLITASAERSSTGAYLRKRVLRIYPGFWVALAVTAFVIAPAGVLLAGGDPACGTACWLTGPDSAIGYIWRNASLVMAQNGIAGTPEGVRVAGVWNGSMWTLAFEFGCYLMVLVLARAGALRRPRLILGITAASWLALAVATCVPALADTITVFAHPVLTPALVLVPVFLTGSCVWLWRDRLPDSGALAAAALAAFAAVQFLPVGGTVPAYSLTTGSMAAPLLVYPLLWVGLHLPFESVGRRHDYSYGVYLYAFPIQQALRLAGAGALGFAGYTAVVVGFTLACAIASWHLVESRAMRLAHRP